MLAIELSDRALAVACDGRVLGVRPSVVFEGSPQGSAGAPAWHALRRSPTEVSTRHLGQLLRGEPAPRAAALCAADLAWRLREVAQDPHSQDRSLWGPVWVAAPALAAPQGLSAFLGVTRSLGLQVAGFVEAAPAQVAAVASSPGSDQGRPALVLELGLHHVAATLVERGGESCSARRVVAGVGGWLELLAGWAELVGRTLVKQTRFDPLHEASSEQLLHDGLPDLVARVLEAGSAPFFSQQVSPQAAQQASVVISRDQLEEASGGLRREVLRLVHGLRPAGQPLDLLVPESLLGVPGLSDDLESLSGCERIGVPPGFAALATSLAPLPQPAPADPVRLLRRVPRGAPPVPGVSRVLLGGRRDAAPPPSHVLWGGEAYPLNTRPNATGASRVALTVGCDPGEGAVLRLGQGLAGISRRHCSFVIVGAVGGAPGTGTEIVLLDHSRYGTFVNGERVAERARVHAGDRIRLGDPGVELALIAVPAQPAAGTAQAVM